jgi:hypothetical protein
VRLYVAQLLLIYCSKFFGFCVVLSEGVATQD